MSFDHGLEREEERKALIERDGFVIRFFRLNWIDPMSDALNWKYEFSGKIDCEARWAEDGSLVAVIHCGSKDEANGLWKKLKSAKGNVVGALWEEAEKHGSFIEKKEEGC